MYNNTIRKYQQIINYRIFSKNNKNNKSNKNTKNILLNLMNMSFSEHIAKVLDILIKADDNDLKKYH